MRVFSRFFLKKRMNTALNLLSIIVMHAALFKNIVWLDAPQRFIYSYLWRSKGSYPIISAGGQASSSNALSSVS
jgi:hypothetical protein